MTDVSGDLAGQFVTDQVEYTEIWEIGNAVRDEARNAFPICDNNA